MPLPTEFTAQIARLQSTGRAAADAASLPGLARRAWMLPEDITGAAPEAGPDLQDPALLRRSVGRRELGQMYADVLRGTPRSDLAPGVGSLVGLKSAVDYLGACERALHARHASRSRCLRWAAARRGAHGDPVYGVFAAVTGDLNAALAAARKEDGA